MGSTSLPLQVSPLIRPGSVNLVIDQFQTSQTVEASPPPPSSQSNTLAFPNENEVIGAERDLFVELTSGASEVRLRVNPFGLLPVLQFDATSGVQGRSIVTWDGTDGDGNPVPTMGLGGRDLTEAGQNVGFAMNLGIDPSGAGEQITILLYQGNSSNVSTATAAIPVTDGTATGFLFVPFSSFVGPVSPSNVDAIQLQVGNGVASADGQIDVIGVVGPKVHNFANTAAAADLADHQDRRPDVCRARPDADLHDHRAQQRTIRCAGRQRTGRLPRQSDERQLHQHAHRQRHRPHGGGHRRHQRHAQHGGRCESRLHRHGHRGRFGSRHAHQHRDRDAPRRPDGSRAGEQQRSGREHDHAPS